VPSNPHDPTTRAEDARNATIAQRGVLNSIASAAKAVAARADAMARADAPLDKDTVLSLAAYGADIAALAIRLIRR
jgi:hypothetical protein